MNKKNRLSESEYQNRLNNLLKGAFNTQLQPLRSLNTATKKRRAAKRRSASQPELAKSSTTTPG
ncbi:hypothetical protein [Bradyrhizobium sp.]|uniref:hypothetical protein n=1 Tax=Bradyrhizobium sp. TaxID=376 RepID=UPI001ED50107|nr:hypothetical protein [Bradyrhizobium sp.]MBV8919585.1 hypothetical protein [Bradyrhizobium sp.]MBV9981013.1 hypothetical protein [Bradyrhizobium sp.]